MDLYPEVIRLKNELRQLAERIVKADHDAKTPELADRELTKLSYDARLILNGKEMTCD